MTLRLPWISRKAYDVKCAESERAWNELHKLVDFVNAITSAHRASFNALLEKYHDLAMKSGAWKSNVPVGIAGIDVPVGDLVNGVPVPSPSIDPTVDLWLDAKFVRGTPLWKQQYREAVKLTAEKVDPEKIIATLGKGQEVSF